MASGPTSENPFSILGDDYVTTRKRAKKGKSVNVAAEFFPDLEEKTHSADNDAKYVVCACEQGGKTLNDFNPFLISKAMEGISKDIIKGSFLRDGKFLLLCKDKKTAEKFLRVDKFLLPNASSPSNPVSIPVKFSYHQSLNNCKGVIFSPLIKNLTKEEIVQGLSNFHVVDARHITKTVSNAQVNTGSVVLTFNRFQLPQSLNFCFTKVSVREYIQNPMRCKSCQLLGHTKNHCSAVEKKCDKCSKTAEHIDPCDTPYCFNCKSEGHGSSDRTCPSFIVEKEVLKIMNQHKCSKYMARKMYFQLNSANQLNSNKSFASAAAEAVRAPTSIAHLAPAPVPSNKPPSLPEAATSTSIVTLPEKSSVSSTDKVPNFSPELNHQSPHPKDTVSYTTTANSHKTKKLTKPTYLKLSPDSKTKVDQHLKNIYNKNSNPQFSIKNIFKDNHSIDLPFLVEYSTINSTPLSISPTKNSVSPIEADL